MRERLASFMASLAVDPEKYAEYQRNRDSAVDRAGLDEEESAALRSGDPSWIYALLAGRIDARSTGKFPDDSPSPQLTDTAYPGGASPQPPSVYQIILPPGSLLLVPISPGALAQTHVSPSAPALQASIGVTVALHPPTLWSSQPSAGLGQSAQPPTVWSVQPSASPNPSIQPHTVWSAQPSMGVNQPAQPPTAPTPQGNR
jgi:hypothetical protein